ncbi:sigma-54-dependent transcriptional regulator [Oharaeibacter diazotrophicus]|uniref:Two component Fis family sigma54 specific transcriptional regulator n=1 Tax=Oharaeibacter diazotrophicus TaxID=1920512 RepID=A0A4R6RMG9_9HYPH|nr:sigma-54 dependent transcriptional regulator [Oharaeibacter diazotrophicus]TDP86966.1 two component Fis family sigma54 specific transcriptional regulator [Oharaeibacter diazotrophicus]BBE71091.1 hydrogenase transcriptional regulatory protein hupR1 [Pleomorphomonas sp. SM30]GLS77843.1 hydrogenase transcriptional regulatory protein HoxA [Oharaeibacter diazotrophicus]
MTHHATVLVIDDEVRSLETLRRVLADEFEVIGARSTGEAEAVLAGEMVQVILCDQRMPGETGVAFLKRVRDQWPDTVRMIISGYTDSEDIIAGINEAGIYQYVTKPWHPDALLASVRDAAALFRLQKEAGGAAAETKPSPQALAAAVEGRRRAERGRYEFDRIVHAPSSPVEGVIALARRATLYDISVLITGESGTGKELLARAIHYGSARGDKPFVVENCGALPDELLESELFGCKKGAFTGAYQDRVGLFEVADGGTIFLDEIGETSPSFQVKLLRVLQEGEIRPLGAQRPRKVDVRVVAATNRDLLGEVDAGRFRRDLYYRLAAFPVHLPALKDRPMDIPPVAARLLDDVNRTFHRRVSGFAPETLAAFAAHRWPGNVRELANEIQRMVALSDRDGPLGPELLSDVVRPAAPPVIDGEGGGGLLRERVEALERALIEASLRRTGGNISRSADELGLSRVGLRAKMERYDLGRGGADAD